MLHFFGMIHSFVIFEAIAGCPHGRIIPSNLMEIPVSLPLLSPEEQRVLGVLMEKARITPENYPLTLNSLISACNQKTSRNPVVSYDENTVISTIDSLKKKGLVSTVTGGSSRTVKYKHNFAILFPLLPQEVVVICLLLLRGPQTVGELNANAGRMHEFESLEELQFLLDKLANANPPYVQRLARGYGQKESRYTHALGDVAQVNDNDTTYSAGNPSDEVEYPPYELHI